MVMMTNRTRQPAARGIRTLLTLAALTAGAMLLVACDRSADDTLDGGGADTEPTTDATEQDQPPAESDPDTPGGDDGGIGVPVLLGAIVAGLIGLGSGFVLGVVSQRRRTREHGSVGSPSHAASPAAETPAPASSVDGHDRIGAIHPAVEAAIAAHDLAGDHSQRVNVARILERFDISIYDPVSEPFDHETQHILEARSCADPALNMTVAATIRPGWRRTDGQVIRPAEVEVWRHQPTAVT